MTGAGGRRAATTLAGAAALITVVTLASRLVGFGRWLAQASYLGTGGIDAPFNAANLLPNVLFEVAAGGALAGAVVPLLSGYLVRGDREQASRTASALLGWTLLVLVPLAGVMALLATRSRGCCGSATRSTRRWPRTSCGCSPSRCRCTGSPSCWAGCCRRTTGSSGPRFAPLVSSLVVIGVYARFDTLADGHQTDVAALSSQALGWLAWGTTAGVAFLALPLLVPVLRTGLRLRPTLRFPRARDTVPPAWRPPASGRSSRSSSRCSRP